MLPNSARLSGTCNFDDFMSPDYQEWVFLIPNHSDCSSYLTYIWELIIDTLYCDYAVLFVVFADIIMFFPTVI